MATYCESLSIEQANAVLCACEGLRINHSWRSVDPCIFLELGQLKRERRRLHNGKKYYGLKGQITCVTESDWRVEKPRSIHFGSGFSERCIDKGLETLIGTRIVTISLSGLLPELRIEFDDGRVISTFTNWSNQPQWFVGFNDTKRFNLHSLPTDADISPWMHVRAGRPKIEYCYDDANTPP